MTALLTEGDLAARWGVTTRYIRTLKAKNEAPPACQVAGRPRYRFEDVLAHEESKTKGGVIPPEARRAMKRAADVLAIVGDWKTATPAARKLVGAVRDELNELTKQRGE